MRTDNEADMRGRRAAAVSGALLVALCAASGCVRRAASPASVPAPASPTAVPTPEPTSMLALPAPTSPPAPTSGTDAFFQTSLRPVLSRKCAPCHWPGGRMYERMPFDDPRTITGHLEGVRRRLKGEDREALERWIASLPASPAAPSR